MNSKEKLQLKGKLHYLKAYGLHFLIKATEMNINQINDCLFEQNFLSCHFFHKLALFWIQDTMELVQITESQNDLGWKRTL